MSARHFLAVATLATAVAAPSPASAAPVCLAVTGSATMPAWSVRLDPGLWVEPAAQTVRIHQHGRPVTNPTAVVSISCVNTGEEHSFTGVMEFGDTPATGASFSPEDLASGTGSATGLTARGAGVQTGYGQVAPGLWHVDTYPDARLTATVTIAYARAGPEVAFVVTLHDMVVDPFAGVPGAKKEWGTVTLTGAAQLQADPGEAGTDVGESGRLLRWSVLPHQVVASA